MGNRTRNHRHASDEESPLLRGSSYLESTIGARDGLISNRSYGHDEDGDEDEDSELLEFSDDDPENPRAWPRRKKMMNIFIIATMAVLSPLGSSMFTPGISKIADALDTTETGVIACQTGFVIALGVGPLVLAPLSETFGRKRLYLICFGIFALIQIPTALAQNVQTLIPLRTIAGFFGSISIANGGGSISDMFEPSGRAGIFGWYLLGPLLGPSIGPLIGGIILSNLDWPWLFWILFILSSLIVGISFFFLHETYVPTLLERRKTQLVQNQSEGETKTYHYQNEDHRPLFRKMLHATQRPLKILFTQPIVLTMASYQALIFATSYSLYTQIPKVYGPEGIPSKTTGYGFSTFQIGFIYLGPGLGFLIAVLFLVPKIDILYNHLTKKNNGQSKPEFRLPLANIGSILIPASLFTFAWLAQSHVHWAWTLVPLVFYGIGQVAVFNSVQNYYIDAFEKYAASAIAAGALFRSFFGGVVPLFVPALFDRLGAGWGMSVFGFVSLVVAPSPVVFYFYGEWLRERFEVALD